MVNCAGFPAGFAHKNCCRRVVFPFVGSADRYLRILAIVVLCTLTATFAGMTHAQALIRIGASMGLTGPYAEFGQTIQRGYQLCIKHANEKGGVLGRKLELTVVDDQSQVPPAVAIYERLITEDKVDLVF